MNRKVEENTSNIITIAMDHIPWLVIERWGSRFIGFGDP